MIVCDKYKIKCFYKKYQNRLNNLNYYYKAQQIRLMRQEIVQGTQIEQEYSCCNGKIFFITDKKQVILTFFLTTTILVLHQIFHVSWFSTRHDFVPLYVLFITHFVNFWAFLVILTSNPGIIQKITYEYENDLSYLELPRNQLSKSHIQIANIMTVRSNLGKLKLCSTCNIYRPPRTHHCSDCGVCIERMDHHCPWLGVCIGKYNYKYFYSFLVSLLAAIIVTILMCISMMAQEGRVFALAIILVLLCFPAFIFVGFMLLFHTYISCINLTTKQYLDEFWTEVAGNPNNKPLFIKNFMKTFFVKSERQIKYKYVQYYVKSQGESSSQHKMSCDNNNQNGHSQSRGSESQKHSNSDQNNVSRDRKDNDRKSQKRKSQQKENSFQTGNQPKSKNETGKRISHVQKNTRMNISQVGKQTQVLRENQNAKKVKGIAYSGESEYLQNGLNKQKIMRRQQNSILDEQINIGQDHQFQINLKTNNKKIKE